MLPKLDGLEVCKRLRAESEVPIIMLTARDDELDKVLGLELGADDYITKPFSIREFRSRVRALLRRAAVSRQFDEDGEVISAQGLTIDLARRVVEFGGNRVQLTYVEFELLRILASHPGRVYSRRMLLEALWGGADYREPRTIDVHVRHLREKLERDPAEPEYILTVRGVGYRFRDSMNPLRSVGARLGLGLAVVVAAALVLVDLIVVPSLERNLIDAKLAQLKEAAPSVGSKLLNTLASLHSTTTIKAAEASADARVIYLHGARLQPARGMSVSADSSPVTSADVEDDRSRCGRSPRIVPSAARSRRGGCGTRRRLTPCSAVRSSCSALRCATPCAASTSSGAGWSLPGLIALAASLARRVPRRFVLRPPDPPARARGRSDRERRLQPSRLSTPARDELGQLAAAFERMRQRLAQLEHARREFIANASHELRTPLFSLGGFLELMADEELDAEDAGRVHGHDARAGRIG